MSFMLLFFVNCVKVKWVRVLYMYCQKALLSCMRPYLHVIYEWHRGKLWYRLPVCIEAIIVYQSVDLGWSFFSRVVRRIGNYRFRSLSWKFKVVTETGSPTPPPRPTKNFTLTTAQPLVCTYSTRESTIQPTRNGIIGESRIVWTNRVLFLLENAWHNTIPRTRPSPQWYKSDF